jgi:hypothetical protein
MPPASDAPCLIHVADPKAFFRPLDRHPNLWVDLSARITELGRQPYSARRFLLEHADRVLYGPAH